MAGDEWQPPRRKMSNGTFEFGDWRPIRDAIDAAQKALGGESFKDIPRDIWNMVGLAISYHEFACMPTCVECRERISHGYVIRCLDCKGALHERCAPKHFWPNGRIYPTPPAG